MGTYYSTYVGCFLKIPVTNVPVTKTFYALPSGEESKTRFNPNTGEEYPKVTNTFSQERYIDGWIEDSEDIDEDDSFRVCEYSSNDKSYAVLIPNETGLCNVDTEWGYSFSLLNFNPEDEILKFKRKFQKILNYYTEKYGKYEIDFGIVRDGS